MGWTIFPKIVFYINRLPCKIIFVKGFLLYFDVFKTKRINSNFCFFSGLSAFFLGLFNKILFAETADHVIKKRVAKFKEASENLKFLRRTIRQSNYEDAKKLLKFHEEWSMMIPDSFPLGSEASVNNKSDASYEIWNYFEKFVFYSSDYHDRVLKLKSALDSGQKSNVSKAFGAMATSCKSCHSMFRN